MRQLQADGMRSIDVGCMQVNLRHHPDAFPDLETAFDPLANARYAARFLSELRAEAGGDWERATGHYHSRTPERAELYRNAVARHLPDARREAAGGPGATPSWDPAWSAMAAAAGGGAGRPPPGWGAATSRPASGLAPLASLPFASRASGGLYLGGGGGGPSPTIIRAPGPGGGQGGGAGGGGAEGGRGRGLDAYRTAPIPVASRLPPFVRPPAPATPG